MRRSKPRRIHAIAIISSSSDTDEYARARLCARTTDDVLRLARHLGYERRAESVEVWVWKQKKRRVGERVRRGETCERWTYEREPQTRPPMKKLLLMERTRVSRNEVPRSDRERN